MTDLTDAARAALDERGASRGPRRAAVALGLDHFKEANERVRAALAEADAVTVTEANAQRYLGCALPAGKSLAIYGTPGNDLGCYLDGGAIEVFGNGQDQAGNTMNDGSIVVHGRIGDAAGYAMRGGAILVRGDCGWRAGIHMKEYGGKRPAIVIGGDAGAFLGEYMAGGIIVLGGRAGDHVGTGMHGGVIYLRRPLDAGAVGDGLVQEPVGKEDEPVLAELLAAYDGPSPGRGRPWAETSPAGIACGPQAPVPTAASTPPDAGPRRLPHPIPLSP